MSHVFSNTVRLDPVGDVQFSAAPFGDSTGSTYAIVGDASQWEGRDFDHVYGSLTTTTGRGALVSQYDSLDGLLPSGAEVTGVHLAGHAQVIGSDSTVSGEISLATSANFFSDFVADFDVLTGTTTTWEPWMYTPPFIPLGPGPITHSGGTGIGMEISSLTSDVVTALSNPWLACRVFSSGSSWELRVSQMLIFVDFVLTGLTPKWAVGLDMAQTGTQRNWTVAH